MNLHALPAIEEMAAPPAEDAVSRVLADARIRDGAELLDALEARRVELGLANSTVEDLANLARGHITKALGPARRKSPSLRTIDRLMSVLGLSFVLVRDPEKIDRAQSSWKPRDEAHVRARPPSPIAIAKSRPVVLAELHRRAARKPWRSMSPREFLAAMMEEAR